MGPLQGIRILEFAGIGPAPFAAMMMADMGAEVICIERPSGHLFGLDKDRNLDFLNRNKQSISLNLKQASGVEAALRLTTQCDGVVEGFRPGTMEKLGLGPEPCMERNSRLVYGRMTGWGQEGPLAKTAGHDLNYIALGGALHAIGPQDQAPVIPLNLVGDFGGGGMLLAFGMVCALLESRQSGLGQVVDAAMIDGTATLMTGVFAAFQSGFWSEQRGTNLLDSGSHFYNVYETRDGRYLSIAAIEPQFYQQLLQLLEMDARELPEQMDALAWPQMREHFAQVFKSRTRDEWCQLLEGTDCCFAPVLSMSELTQHPHHQARKTFTEDSGYWQPNPAPRFGRSKPATPVPAPHRGQDTAAVLSRHGFSAEEITQLQKEH